MHTIMARICADLAIIAGMTVHKIGFIHPFTHDALLCRVVIRMQFIIDQIQTVKVEYLQDRAFLECVRNRFYVYRIDDVACIDDH